MRYIDVPSKVIQGYVLSATGLESWPYDDGHGDAYWYGGTTPKPYRWEVTVDVTPQRHSSHRTRSPYQFDAMDVSVGDYISDQQNGVTVQIISVIEKTATTIKCVVEDILRYNTYRDPNGSGNGIFNSPIDVLIFETNESGMPVVDPIPSSGTGSAFYANLMSRFQNFEQSANFLLTKMNHGFVMDDLISVDPETKSFVKTDSDHPFIVGTVSNVEFGPNNFMVNPIQKIDSSYDSLIGDVGDVLYSSSDGRLSLTGQQPVMLKLRNHTKTSTTNKISGVDVQVGSSFNVNGIKCTVAGTGTALDVIEAFNEHTISHGVVASSRMSPTIVTPNQGFFYGEPALDCSSAVATATINGVLVSFTTTTVGSVSYGAPYSLEEDMAFDINAAGIPGIVASYANNTLIITNQSGGSVTIANGDVDSAAVPFAGPNSATGLPLFTDASTDALIGLVANDARAINLFDVEGTALADLGLFSVENGIKAAAMFIEQGIRQAATYVVATIAARDNLNVLFGDQCFVQDKGNGEWGHYIRTFDDVWVKIADKDSSESDAQTVEVEITHDTDFSGIIHTISGGSRVSFVTVTVTEAFDGVGASITVGDGDDTGRLMTEDQNDLTSSGVYSTTPSYTYSGQNDVNIVFDFSSAGSTVGKATIAISYT